MGQGTHKNTPATSSAPAKEGDAHPSKPAQPRYFQRELAELEELRVSANYTSGRHQHTFKSGAVYIGDWRGSARDGFGVQRWPDGASYAGQWQDNCADGLGRFQHASGDVYSGHWKNNVAHGYGIYHGKDLTKYEGQWVEDKQEGFAVLSWGDGSRYAGLFKNGLNDGWGTYNFPNGSQYAGAWSCGSMHGPGVSTGCDGNIYRGSYHRSLMSGIGKYTWADGRQYVGEYFQDKKHGFGIAKWPDGRRYEGYWQCDKEHGQGKAVTPDGATLYARWCNGEVPSSARSFTSARRAEGLANFLQNRTTPRSARSNRSDVGNSSRQQIAYQRQGTPGSVDLKNQTPSEFSASTRDQTIPDTNHDYRQAPSGLEKLPEDHALECEYTDDLEEETCGNLQSLHGLGQSVVKSQSASGDVPTLREETY